MQEMWILSPRRTNNYAERIDCSCSLGTEDQWCVMPIHRSASSLWSLLGQGISWQTQILGCTWTMLHAWPGLFSVPFPCQESKPKLGKLHKGLISGPPEICAVLSHKSNNFLVAIKIWKTYSSGGLCCYEVSMCCQKLSRSSSSYRPFACLNSSQNASLRGRPRRASCVCTAIFWFLQDAILASTHMDAWDWEELPEANQENEQGNKSQEHKFQGNDDWPGTRPATALPNMMLSALLKYAEDNALEVSAPDNLLIHLSACPIATSNVISL